MTTLIPWDVNEPVKQYYHAVIINNDGTPKLSTVSPNWGGRALVCVSDDPTGYRFVVKILGLCSSSSIPDEYVKIKEESSTYISKRNYTLKWVNGGFFLEKGEVKISPQQDLSLGTFDVKLENDRCTAGKDDKTVRITITHCKEDQFTCFTGECVSMDLRCNRITDCPDSSDEKGCGILKIDKSTYIKEYPPIAVDANYEPIKLPVNVSIDIKKILDIDEIEGIFRVAFDLHTVWVDKRLRYMNLKESENLNTLTESEKQDIWTPAILFSNTENKNKVITDDRVIAKVSRRGSSTVSKDDEALRTLYYEGAENPITFSREYTINFICKYDMAWYPFDLQRCELHLEPFGNTGDYVFYINSDINYYDEIDLSKYYIKQWQYVPKKTKKGVGVEGIAI